MERNYVKGRGREYLVMHHLVSIGAVDISRSYASKGRIDVRGIFPDKVLLIQSKARFISKKEMQGLVDLAKSLTAPNIHVQLWKFKKRQWQIWDLCHPVYDNNCVIPLSLREFKNIYGFFTGIVRT